MSWLKPSMYIAGVLIVIFGGALVLDLAAGMLEMTMYLPSQQHTRQKVELLYFEMWRSVNQIPPENVGSHE